MNEKSENIYTHKADSLKPLTIYRIHVFAYNQAGNNTYPNVLTLEVLTKGDVLKQLLLHYIIQLTTHELLITIKITISSSAVYVISHTLKVV